jgi:hypothetical protein
MYLNLFVSPSPSPAAALPLYLSFSSYNSNNCLMFLFAYGIAFSVVLFTLLYGLSCLEYVSFYC